MAKKTKKEEVEIKENISSEPLEEVMADRYATYAKYVIQDRAIPDVRDGLKPVQRRILFAMYNNGNTFNRPTRKCAHSVGEVMGKYHPHGDTSIYEALARMSQDWKVRAPLIDFQGNNGSIDGDSPAAYRYTEARLSQLANEVLKDIDKNTVDMQLTFDDSEFEPTVLPARFPNLYVNGSEGIAVALATEIPTHNLREVINATIYRINHPNCSLDDLLNIIPGPDFPTGGIIYNSDGLRSIYENGRGRIEIAARYQIVDNGSIKQIVINEVPYKVVKKNIVYEIDKIRHSKSIDGIIEVRDESDFNGIRIVVDVRKNAPVDLIVSYLLNKTSMKVSYSANIVAIVDGRPKTLSLTDYLDAYISHQVDVLTRLLKFELDKLSARLHIVEGLILAALNINDVVEIIRHSKDKQDSKLNIIAKYDLSNEQAEAIVMMPLYKLSHTDIETLQNEKEQLINDINYHKETLADPKKINKAIINDLNQISKTYGDARRTSFEDKVEQGPIDKRFLISKEKIYFSITKDGYFKRSSQKSYLSSLEKNPYPEVKQGDALIAIDCAYTTDFLLCFTNLGNYMYVPIFEIEDNKWKDKGVHINSLITMNGNEKIVSVIVADKLRDDLFTILLTKNGQIKRTPTNFYQTNVRARPIKCIKLANGDELVDVKLSTGNANIMVFSSLGYYAMFNENELLPLSLKASGVKAMSLKGGQSAVDLVISQLEEKTKIVLITDKSCLRIFDTSRGVVSNRLSKNQIVFKSFKSDIHHLVYARKVVLDDKDNMNVLLYDNNYDSKELIIDDFHLTDIEKYAKKNIDLMLVKERIRHVFAKGCDYINDEIKSQPIILKKDISNLEKEEMQENNDESKSNVEQITLFDDFE